jgi:phage-related minor tail protein
MALADTAQLLVNLVVKSNASTVLGKDKTTLGDLGKTLLSVGGAAGFGALTAGALSAEAAQGKFMAATGKTRGEAEKFVTSMDGLAGSVGTTGMKFEDLAALGTTVEQQFGTTGQKTQDLTEKIAEFAKVTGRRQRRGGALGDTLPAMGLDADCRGASWTISSRATRSSARTSDRRAPGATQYVARAPGDGRRPDRWRRLPEPVRDGGP